MGSAASSTIRQRLIGIAVAKGEQDRDVEFASHSLEQLPEARVYDLSVARSQHVVTCDYEEIGFGCVSPQMLEGIQCLGVAVQVFEMAGAFCLEVKFGHVNHGEITGRQGDPLGGVEGCARGRD